MNVLILVDCRKLVGRCLLKVVGRFPCGDPIFLKRIILIRLSALVISTNSIFRCYSFDSRAKRISLPIYVSTGFFFIVHWMEIYFVCNFGNLFLFHFEVRNYTNLQSF